MNRGHRKRSRWAAWVVPCLLALLCASPAAAQAGDDELRNRARAQFEQGVAAYDEGRYEQALSHFQEAHRLRPHPLVHANIANCYQRLGRPLPAIFHFQRFLESDAGTPQQREEVTAALGRLRGQVGKLLLRVSPDGAMVTIDHGEQRRAPLLEPVLLEAGEHALQVRLAGYKTLQRTVHIDGGSTYELNIALEREGDGGAGEPGGVLKVTKSEDPELTSVADPFGLGGEPGAGPLDEQAVPQDRPSGRRALPQSAWIAGGATAALGVSTLVFGVLALSADADFEDERERLAAATTPNERVARYADASEAADRAQAFATTTDILLLLTAAGAAVTMYFVVTHDPEEEPRARVQPVLSPELAGMRVRGAF